MGTAILLQCQVVGVDAVGVLLVPRGLVSGKHAPRVPVQVPSVGCVLRFSKAVDVPGGKAGGDAEEHVVEREAEELRIPDCSACTLPADFNPKWILLNENVIELALGGAGWNPGYAERDWDFIPTVAGVINLETEEAGSR